MSQGAPTADPVACARTLRDLADKIDKEEVDLLECREERGTDVGEIRLYVSYRRTGS